ncbi:hypothetical protein ABMZ81_03805 [Morganella morganii]|uniref:hypothetical protein n=1 Tax=Morganella morganii TaxID=582 RepID=UPI003EBE5301
MEFKGTPGPWINVGGWVDAAGNGIICSLSAVSMKPEDIDDANANLIAAAPDLLNALINLIEYWKLDETAEAHAAMIAINKALGG